MNEQRKNYLIAKALWEFIAEDHKKPIERQCRSDVDDMELILDKYFPRETMLLIKAEALKSRT